MATISKRLSDRKLFAIGGFAAALVLAGIGLTVAIVGYQGVNEVRDTLKQENITASSDTEYAGQLVDNGAKAHAQAEIIREHQLARTDGMTYAEMGRFATPDGDPAGTSDPEAAATDAEGNPLPNEARSSWLTALTLITALDTAYFAEQVGFFSMVVGIVLVITGGGFGVLTVFALWQRQPGEVSERAAAPGKLAEQQG